MTDEQVKALVRERDENKCVECGMTAEEHRARFGRALDVHRKNPSSRYTVDGCVTLCRPCHGPKPKLSCGPRSMVHVDLPDDLGERLRQTADALGLSRGRLICLMMAEKLPEYEERARQASSHRKSRSPKSLSPDPE